MSTARNGILRGIGGCKNLKSTRIRRQRGFFRRRGFEDLLETARIWRRRGFAGCENLLSANICRWRGLGSGENLKGIGSSQVLTAHRIWLTKGFDSQQDLAHSRIWARPRSEDCFYYCSERNNVVVLFGTLKVQSFILTEVSDCGLLIVVTSSNFLKRKNMLKEKSS